MYIDSKTETIWVVGSLKNIRVCILGLSILDSFIFPSQTQCLLLPRFLFVIEILQIKCVVRPETHSIKEHGLNQNIIE